MIADQIMNHHVLLRTLKDKNRIRGSRVDTKFASPSYNATAQGGFYSHFDAFDLDGSDDATALQFEIRQAHEPVGISAVISALTAIPICF